MIHHMKKEAMWGRFEAPHAIASTKTPDIQKKPSWNLPALPSCHLKADTPFVAEALPSCHLKADTPFVAEALPSCHLKAATTFVAERSPSQPRVLENNTSLSKKKKKKTGSSYKCMVFFCFLNGLFLIPNDLSQTFTHKQSVK